MNTEQRSLRIPVVGLVGLLIGGCSDGETSTTLPGVTGGTSSVAGGSAGIGSGGTSGSGTSGGASGTTSTGGSAGVVGAGSGGTAGGGGSEPSGGSGGATGGAVATGGASGAGGASADSGGAANGGGGMGAEGGSGGAMTSGGASGSAGAAGGGSGGVMTSGGAAGSGGSGGGNPGTCTASKATGGKASGSGPHQVTIETNSDEGINEGTIFRPADLSGDEKFPIFVWGEGGCSRDGLSNQAAMAEIASHGYFVVADGTPNNMLDNRPLDGNVTEAAKPLLRYITWAIAENDKPCSAYYQSLDTTKVAANGFSCGGLMAEGTAADPRMTTWGITSSGMFSANQAFYDSVHTPVLILVGGQSDNAYPNGLRDYENISQGDQPVLFFSKNIGHGGDLFSSRGGDFTKINLAWINWWLKGDMGATGKGALVGAACTFCNDSAWETRSANVP